jgi:O-antigen ligase
LQTVIFMSSTPHASSLVTSPVPPHAQLKLPPGLGLELDLYRVSLALLTIITISRIHQHFSYLAAMRPGLVLVGIAGASAILNPKTLAREPIFSTWPARLIGLFGLLACLSVPFSISIGAAGLFIITDYSKTLLFALLVVLAIRNVRDLYTFAWAYVAGTGVLIWMSIFLFHLSTQGSKAARLGRLYSWDGNDLGVILLVGLGLTLLTFQTSGRVGRIVSAVMLLGIGVTLGRTGSRGAFLGLIAVGIALLILLKSISVYKRVGFVVVTAAALVTFAPRGYWAQMGTIFKIKQDYNYTTTDGRKQVAMRGVNYMLDHPVFGLGIHNFSKAECFDSEKAREHIAGTGIRCTAPHNSYVEAGAELGIPGLLLWLLLIFGGIRSMLKLRTKLPASWARGSPEERFLYLAPLYLSISMIGFSVSSFFVGFAWLDPVYFLAAMMAGIFSVTKRQLSLSVGHAPSAAGVLARGQREERTRRMRWAPSAQPRLRRF